jgi:hypothetical protein
VTDEELDKLVRATIDPARQSDGGDGTIIPFGFETLYERVYNALAQARREALEEAAKEVSRLRSIQGAWLDTRLLEENIRALIDKPRAKEEE